MKNGKALGKANTKDDNINIKEIRRSNTNVLKKRESCFTP